MGTVAVRETFARRIAEYRPNVNNNPQAVGGQRTSSIGAADETDKLVHVTRGIVGVFRATAMPEVAVPFSFRRAPAGMSLNPENSSTGWPSFGERFKINPGLYSSLDERRGSGQPAHSPSPESQHEIAAHGTWIGGTCQMRLRFRG